MKSNKKSNLLLFRDNKGREISLPDDLTISDFVKLGIKFKLEPIEKPLLDNWFAHPPKNHEG